MKIDFAEVAENNKKAKKEVLSLTLEILECKIRFLANNFDTLNPKEISKYLKDLNVCSKILARSL